MVLRSKFLKEIVMDFVEKITSLVGEPTTLSFRMIPRAYKTSLQRILRLQLISVTARHNKKSRL